MQKTQGKDRTIKLNAGKLVQAHRYTYKEYEVLFPFQPYPIQQTFMNSVLDALDKRSHALLQSPTGTGKTMCLLVAILTWLRHHTHLGEGEHPKLIYSSRTHHQLRQVVRQIKKTCFVPKVITASSRDHACVNSQINSLRGHELEVQCRKRIGLGQNEPQDKKDNVKHCQYYFNLHQQVKRQKYSQPVIRDLEQVKIDGLSSNYCPFFLTRQQQIRKNADIILMPYNYLLDHNTFDIYKEDIRNSIIVFDEAHNVLGSASEGHSFKVTLDMIGLCINELKNVEREFYLIPYESRQTLRLSPSNIQFLGKRFKIFASNLYEGKQKMLNTADEFSFGVMMQDAKMGEFLASCILMKGQEISSVCDIIGKMVGISSNIMMEFPTTYTWSIDKTCGFLANVNKILQQWLNTDKTELCKLPWDQNWMNYYKLHLKVEATTTVLELWCLDPSIAFRQILKQKPYNIILTSGTLSPLYSWEAQIKLPFEIKLVNKHVIKPEQLLVACVSKINSSRMLFTYQNRANRTMISDFGNFLLKISSTVPHGVLVVFSSYAVLSDTRMQLIDSKVWEKINLNKEIMAEPKEQSKLAQTLSLYGKKVRTKRGAFLFGVFRGKIAEGIDLSDELCRAVIVVGVPYPPVKDLKIEQKRKYLDLKSQRESAPVNPKLKSFDGRTWYTLHTIRAVNQAIGRVIRHIKDYGAIYFVDSRYSSNQELNGMISGWAKSALSNYQDIDLLMRKTSDFFQRNALCFGDISVGDTNNIDLQLEELEPQPLPRMQPKKLILTKKSFENISGADIKLDLKKSRQSSKKKIVNQDHKLEEYFTLKRTKQPSK